MNCYMVLSRVVHYDISNSSGQVSEEIVFHHTVLRILVSTNTNTHAWWLIAANIYLFFDDI